MKKKVFIPARYKSSRLPGKPLIEICGRSLILRVCDKVATAIGKENLVVLTDDDRIFSHVEAGGYDVLMTSENCETGTDRIAEAIKQLDVDVAINVQGDEPLLNPDDIKSIYDMANESEVINCYCTIDSSEDLQRSSLPKVVFNQQQQLLYMSRAAIPNNKALTNGNGHKQVCIYSFPKEALKLYGPGKEKSPLESIEDIEILRLLEAGWTIKMIPASDTIAVDVPEDVEAVEKALNEN